MAAAGVLVAGFAALPAIASMILVATYVPEEPAWHTPWLYPGTVLGPALIEIAAVILLCHAAVRRSSCPD